MGGSYVTINTVQSQYVDGSNPRTVVSGQEPPGSPYEAQSGQPAVILYYTEDPAARAATYSFSIRAIAGTAVPQQAAGYQSTNDEAILIMFEWGSLAPGQTHTAVYRTMLAAGDVTELIEDTAEEAAATAGAPFAAPPAAIPSVAAAAAAAAVRATRRAALVEAVVAACLG